MTRHRDVLASLFESPIFGTAKRCATNDFDRDVKRWQRESLNNVSENFLKSLRWVLQDGKLMLSVFFRLKNRNVMNQRRLIFIRSTKPVGNLRFSSFFLTSIAMLKCCFLVQQNRSHDGRASRTTEIPIGKTRIEKSARL